MPYAKLVACGFLLVLYLSPVEFATVSGQDTFCCPHQDIKIEVCVIWFYLCIEEISEMRQIFIIITSSFLNPFRFRQQLNICSTTYHVL